MRKGQYPGDARCNLLERLQPFPAHGSFKVAKTCNIPAGARQAFDETAFYRVRDAHKHDRYRRGDLAYCRNPWVALYQDDFRFQRDHLLGECEHLFGECNVAPIVPPKIDAKVATRGPPQVLERLLERHQAWHGLRISFRDGTYDADPPQTLRLRTRRKRPCCRAADQAEELASSHVTPLTRRLKSPSYSSLGPDGEPNRRLMMITSGSPHRVK